MKNIVVEKIESLKRTEDLLKLDINVFDIIVAEVQNLSDKDVIEYLKSITNGHHAKTSVKVLECHDKAKEFFKNNCSDILYLLNEYQKETGYIVDFEICEVLLSWFAFRCVVFGLGNELEIEL